MNKNTLKYLSFLSGGLSVVSGTAGLVSIEHKTQTIVSFTLMLLLAIAGAIFFLKFKKYQNGTAYLQECINAINPPSDEWASHTIQNEAELRSVWEISQTLYREENVDYNTVLSWWKCYPAGIFILYKQANIVGYFSMWPVKEGTFKQITSGRRRERELKRQSIIGKNSAEAKSCWYITNIVVQKKIPQNKRYKNFIERSITKMG